MMEQKISPGPTTRDFFLVVFVITAASFLLSGANDILASIRFGVAGGFGALALDIYRVVTARWRRSG